MTTEINKKEKTQQYLKEYFNKNKEKLTEDFICEDCGGKYQYMSKAHHIKTKKHLNSLLIKKLQKDNETMKNLVIDINKKIENI
jgi:conjugal transfer/entry exclusion protein